MSVGSKSVCKRSDQGSVKSSGLACNNISRPCKILGEIKPNGERKLKAQAQPVFWCQVPGNAFGQSGKNENTEKAFPQTSNLRITPQLSTTAISLPDTGNAPRARHCQGSPHVYGMANAALMTGFR